MAGVVVPAPPPAVPPLDPDPGCSTVGDQLRAAAKTVSGVQDWSHDSGAPDGWTGDASEAAGHARTRLADSLSDTLAVLGSVAAACDRFAALVSSLDQRRTTLVEEQGSLAGRQRDLAARAAEYTEDEEAGLRAEAGTLDRDISAFSGRVSTWQTDLTRAEDALVEAFSAVDTVAEARTYAEGRSAGVAATVDRLISQGVLPPEVRGLDAAALRAYLIAHPDVATALTQVEPSQLGTGPEAALALLLAPAFTTPEGAAELAEQRRVEIRALFEGLPPEDASLLAMLFPGTVGNLSGVPFDQRAEANTVQVVAALDAERGELSDLQERHEDHQHDWDFLGLNNDDLEDPIANSQDRIDLYESILRDDRQILYFDAAGDGAVAELHGTIDSGTSNVGVQVPGTTTDMASFQGVADTAGSFVDNSDGLAMVSWMGGDLPDGVLSDAPFANYARDLGPQLANFSHDVRQEVDFSSAAPNDVQTTYLGHSYGGAVVGRAELAGLDADRVLHVESAGMGHDIHSPDDLPDSQDDVHRYSMTAPGDFIELTQGKQATENVGHGHDPDDFEGTTRLHTGDKTDGSYNTGFDAHSGVFEVNSDAWENMRQVLTGGTVETYRAPTYDVYPSGGMAPPVMVQSGWGPGSRVDVP